MRWTAISSKTHKSFHALSLNEAAHAAFEIFGDGVYLHDAGSGQLWQVVNVSNTCTVDNPSELELETRRINNY